MWRVARSNVRMPSLAQHDVGIAFRQYVLRRHQPLLDRGTGSPLEQDRHAASRRRAEQREVLHVPGADLQHVGKLRDERNLFPAEHLGDDGQSGALAGLREVTQSLHTETLKVIGRGARLERAAAQHVATGIGHRLCRLHDHFAALHRAGAGDQYRCIPAEGDIPHLDHRAIRGMAPVDERNIRLPGVMRRRRVKHLETRDAFGPRLVAAQHDQLRRECLDFLERLGDTWLGGGTLHIHVEAIRPRGGRFRARLQRGEVDAAGTEGKQCVRQHSGPVIE